MENQGPGRTFDFPAFKLAFESRDVATWAGFYADDAIWIEYKHRHPPSSPRMLEGKDAITGFLGRVKASNVTLRITDEVIGPTRAAFCLWCALDDGRRVIEHIIIHFAHGRITRQVDVEAWDHDR